MLIDIRPFLEPPKPISTHISHQGGVTAISRMWNPEDVPRCDLCPTCAACPDGLCLVQVATHVTAQDAPMFRVPFSRERRGWGRGSLN